LLQHGITAGLAAIRRLSHSLFHAEQAQDTFEYVIIIGVVVAAIILAVTTPIGSQLINFVVGQTSQAVSQLYT
jgi:hypothetical protein